MCNLEKEGLLLKEQLGEQKIKLSFCQNELEQEKNARKTIEKDQLVLKKQLNEQLEWSLMIKEKLELKISEKYWEKNLLQNHWPVSNIHVIEIV